MCTDYEIWYSCGHKAQPALNESPDHKNSGINAESGIDTPTATVTKHCKLFQDTQEVCPVFHRLVITQVWEIQCHGRECKPIPMNFDDRRCNILQNIDQELQRQGDMEATKMTMKRKQELRRLETKLCQPRVWGRKGPHIKRTRHSKTKEERERERREKEEQSSDLNLELVEETPSEMHCRKAKPDINPDNVTGADSITKYEKEQKPQLNLKNGTDVDVRYKLDSIAKGSGSCAWELLTDAAAKYCTGKDVRRRKHGHTRLANRITQKETEEFVAT